MDEKRRKLKDLLEQAYRVSRELENEAVESKDDSILEEWGDVSGHLQLAEEARLRAERKITGESSAEPESFLFR